MAKQKLFIFELILLVGFLILPEIGLAVDLEEINLRELGKYLVLPENKVQELIHSLIGIFHDEFENMMTARWYSPPYPTPEEMAVPSIMKKAVQMQVLNHLLTDAPAETTWAIVKNATKIARVFLAEDPSVILNELEKESVQKAVGYGMNYLLQNEIRVAPGAMSFEYISQKGNKKEALFQYVMVYKPINTKRGEVLIRFYSPNYLEPPKNKISAGGLTGIYTELTTDLPPFIVDIRGTVEDYQWVGKPLIEIDFPPDVPDLGIKPLSWWEKYVLKPIESQIKEVDILVTKVTGKSLGLTDIWEKVKSFISKITTFFPAALVRTPEVKEAPWATNETSEAESQSVNPEPQPEPEPEPEPKLTLAELQEMLDDIAEKIDIFSRQVSELVEAEKQQIEEEIEESEEKEDAKKKESGICIVNINTASKEELQKITGVGLVISQKIIEARPFYSLNDLIKVSGIGEKTLQGIIGQGCAYVDEFYSKYAGSGPASSADALSPQIILNYSGENPVNKEIEAAILALNLKNTAYDVKISIENGTTTLSEIFNEKENKWQNSYNYLTEVFSGTSFSGNFKLKIKDAENSFRGEADIFARVRESGKSSYLEFKGKINIIDPEQATSTPTQEEVPPLAVVINEIAWMGTATSSNDEWIELHNTTKNPIDLTGWKLVSITDNSPNITLNGSISPLGFYLLERTDDNTIKNILADKIYTGALSNNGEKLELRDNQDNLIDSVDCSEKWFAGSSSPDYISMERINPRTSGSDSNNWANNNQTIRNGLDANNNPINGTPKAQNSIYQSLPPEAVADLTIDSQNSFANKVKLTWSTSTDHDTLSENLSYWIYSSKGEINEDNLVATTSATSILISDLDYNSTYYFGVKAFDGSNYSSLSTSSPYQTATLTTIASGFSVNDLNPDNMKNNGRKIARASNGDLYVVYSRAGKIFLAESTEQGRNWTEIEVTPQEQLEQINPSIAIDSQNNFHIVWQGKISTTTTTTNPYQIRYTKYDGTSFPAIEDLTNNSEWNQEIPVITIDSQDDVHVVWVNKQQTPDRDNNLVSTPQLLHRVFTNQWQPIEKVAEIDKGGFSSFALSIDSQDNLHLISRESSFWDTGNEAKIQYRKRTLEDWSEIGQLAPDGYGLQEDFPSLAIDSQDNLHIVWYRTYFNESRCEINYLKYTASATSWSEIETLDRNEFSLQWVIVSPSIALDSQDHLYVIWKRLNEKISQIEYSNSWEEVKNLNLGSQDSFAFTNLLLSFYPSISGKKTNQPKTGYTFIYYEGTELKFYASPDLTWE